MQTLAVGAAAHRMDAHRAPAGHARPSDTIEALREIIDEQREEIRQLRAELFAAEWTPPDWLSLTRTEETILRLLVARPRVVDGWALCEALEAAGSRADQTGKILQVYICKLRTILRPHGIQIETVWGRGYRLDPAGRARLLQMEDGA